MSVMQIEKQKFQHITKVQMSVKYLSISYRSYIQVIASKYDQSITVKKEKKTKKTKQIDISNINKICGHIQVMTQFK